MFNIDLDFYKDVKDFSPSLCDRNQTGVAIMNQQIALHQVGSDIIDTTCSVCDITHNYGIYFDFIDLKTESFKNVRDNAGIEHQSLWEL